MNKNNRNGILLIIGGVLIFFLFPMIGVRGNIVFIPYAISLILVGFGIKNLIPKEKKEGQVSSKNSSNKALIITIIIILIVLLLLVAFYMVQEGTFGPELRNRWRIK